MRPEDQLESRNQPDVERVEESTPTSSIDAKMEQASRSVPALSGKAEDLRQVTAVARSPTAARYPRVRGHTVAALIVIGAAIAGFIAYDLGETKFESLFDAAPQDEGEDRSTGE